jgi:hypothetical protein
MASRLGRDGGARASVERSWFLGALLLALAAPSRAEVPFPSCASVACSDPADFAGYLFTTALPDDYDSSSGDAWKYERDTGMGIAGDPDSLWASTTGRPDVVVAVLDSGIEWDRRDLAGAVWLNPGELPVPPGCASHDCNGDGFVSVMDFAEACAADLNASGFCDGQDLIRFYSDGVDDDGNGYLDDIAGWDFLDDDNDPSDDVRYGHGTGEASDQVAEANNGSGFPGFAPSSLFLPLKVADSFVAFDTDFSQALVYAVDRGVSVVSEALGTVFASPTGQAAIDYAYRRGIPVIASAADEESRHHNYPANYEHTIWVNSVRNGDGTFLDETENGFDLLNGCTNYGGRAWVAIPSSSCSSEATGRAAGLTLLLISHAKNQIDRGLFSPYPGLGTPFSAEEVRQLLRASARDVDHSDDLSTVLALNGGLLGQVLSAPALGLEFGSSRFPTLPGWDQFTGWGRPDGPTLLALVTDATVPPEVDLSGGPRWFESLDPKRAKKVELRGTLRAVRADNVFDWTLDVGCGIQPESFSLIASGSATAPIEDGLLARWDIRGTAKACGFNPREPIEAPDAHTVTLRLRATTRSGPSSGEDRRTLSIHSDPSLRLARFLGGSGESSPVLVDVDRDGVLDLVQASADGAVRALDGASGADLPGFPAWTEALDVHPSPAYASGAVPVPREAILAALAADDLDGDGRVEIVAASVEGRVYVLDDQGRMRAGFPVTTNPRLSDPAQRDPLNDTHPGIAAAPTLADLDGDGALEILVSGLDGHLYAWGGDGATAPGFPVRLADPDRVTVDPATGKATPLPGFDVRERGAKSLSSPAVGDLDGDGWLEIVVATNEEYGDEGPTFAIESTLLAGLSRLLGDSGDFSFDAAGRVYAVHHDGSLHAGGPFVAGWPAPVPLLAPGLLPTVGTGTPGSPALADVDGDERLEVAIFGAVGPVALLSADGSPYLGMGTRGAQRVLAHDFPQGFPTVPASAGSADAPFFGALGSGAFGDLTGDGLPEYVAPTGGLRKLLDVAAPAWQDRVDPSDPTRVVEGFAHHQITAWDPASGALLEAFPREMDDMQFIASPAMGDVDGDGLPEVVQGSGAYLLRAYRADGTAPPGFPKLTHGWNLASPTLGDLDGDGLVEVVAVTREGWLFVWDTPGVASAAALPWAGYGRDRRNTQNLASGVTNVVPEPSVGVGVLAVLSTTAILARRRRASRAGRGTADRAG